MGLNFMRAPKSTGHIRRAPGGAGHTEKSWRARFLPLALWGAALYLMCLAFTAAFVLPTRALDSVPYSTAVYDRHGTLLRLSLSSDQKYRMMADPASLPPRFIEAILLKEDRSFWMHPGVNPAALVRAFLHSLVLHDYRAGGSTITMQLARLLYGLDTDTAGGKLLQIWRALSLELVYSKERILCAYCSLVPCGGNVEGFPSASLIYFRKPLSALSLSETLLLCGVPQRPERGGLGSEAARKARALLYDAWLTRHPEDASESVSFDMPEAFSAALPFLAPHAVDSLLASHPGAARIDSTLDLPLQTTVERMVAGFVASRRSVGVANASALLVRRRGMEVLSEVGSAGFWDAGISGQVNGTEARRSPGSALKPFLYALAMEQSLIHPMTVLKDAPVHFSGYNPDNFDDEFMGPVRAADALILSRNVPAVSLSRQVDPDLYSLLSRCGIGDLRPRSDYGLSIALGTAEVTMKELAAMYGMLANRGEYVPLREVGDGGAQAASAAQAGGGPRTLLTPQAAFLVRKILEGKPRPDRLDAGGVSSGRPVAWKTGTSIGFRDAWSVGIFDSFILCVWVGNFDGSGNPEFVGLRSAAPLMFSIMDAIRGSGLESSYAGEADDTVPEGVTRTRVCAVSGKIPTSLCPTTVDTWFIPGVSPIDACDIHQEIYIDAATGQRRTRPEAGKTRTVVMEIWPSDIMELFTEAGLPRRLPPPFAPGEDLTAMSESGQAPQIISPLSKGEYAVAEAGRPGSEIPLIAVVPSDSQKVYWFLDESYLGESPRGKAFFWKAVPGTYVLRAMDERGRASSLRFTVVSRN